MTNDGDAHIIESASSVSDPIEALGTLADLATFVKALPSIETAYRRGYCQGFYAAIESAKWATTYKLQDFLYKNLYGWRHRKHGGKFEEAPQLTKDGIMRLGDFTSKDGFVLEVGQFVRIAPQAFDRRTHMTGKVLEPGKQQSLVEPANHQRGEWIENRYLTLHKAKNTQRGILFAAIQKEPMSKPQLKIANTYSPDEIVTAQTGDTVAVMPDTKPLATAEDFDALANMLNRLRESAHAKLMKLSDDEKTAKALLAEAQSKIAAHMNQCRALGIDLGPSKEAKAG